MSATGRNVEGHERDPDDNYATPAGTTRLILPKLRPYVLYDHVAGVPEDLLTPTVLDPCCGRGAILDVVSEAYPRSLTRGIELDNERAGQAQASGHRVVCDDALLASCWPDGALLVTNPPFRLAMEFIEKAILWVNDGVHAGNKHREAAFLLRLNFLGSQRRLQFHKEHPSDVYVLPKRPSFAHGKTDATEYAWFVWATGRGNRWFMLEVG